MGLSSNSLIHLTREKDVLKEILKDNFKVKYSYEIIRTSKGWFGGGVPMVCFCDIPLSQLKNHIKGYGKYGIGLKKEWGLKNSLNPVLYVEKQSNIGEAFRVLTSETLKEMKNVDEYNDAEKGILQVMAYMKNYEGEFDKNGIKNKNYRFSDEREWRYTPPINETELVIPRKRFHREINNINDSIANLRLHFEPNDINYIIISDESEISDFVDVLKDAKRKKYTYEDVERLMTRIITTEQILSDF